MRGRGISISGLARLSLTNLRVNWLRSFLTVLGMVFGTAAVIATLSSSEGAKDFINSELKKLGTNIINVKPPANMRFDSSDVAFIKSYVEEYSAVSLVSRLPTMLIRSGSKVSRSQLIAVEPSYFQDMRLKVVRGQAFDEFDSKQGRQVAVVGANLAKELFGSQFAIGKKIHLFVGKESLPFEVVGTLEKKGVTSGADFNDVIFVPSNFAAELNDPGTKTLILATLRDENKSEESKKSLRALYSAKFKQGLTIEDAREAIERTQSIWEQQNLVGLVLAGVSLLTGGVGIMNVMLLSIHQRKREIGLRKAIGATNSDIRLQFLLEAVFICLAGGMLGVLVGFSFGQKVAELLGQWEARTTYGAILLAMGFSAFTGIFFGLLPAVRASRLDPYDALRS